MRRRSGGLRSQRQGCSATSSEESSVRSWTTRSTRVHEPDSAARAPSGHRARPLGVSRPQLMGRTAKSTVRAPGPATLCRHRRTVDSNSDDLDATCPRSPNTRLVVPITTVSFSRQPSADPPDGESRKLVRLASAEPHTAPASSTVRKSGACSSTGTLKSALTTAHASRNAIS